MIDKNALQLLLFAQQYYPKEYGGFVASLSKQDGTTILWDFENKEFASALQLFKEQFLLFLSKLDPPVDKNAVEQNVPTKEVLDPLVEDLEKAQEAKKNGQHFESKGKKVDRFIKESKKQLTQPSPEPSSAQEIIESDGAKLMQSAAVINKSPPLPVNDRGLPVIPTNYFAAIAKTPMQKMVAPIMDMFLTQGNKTAVIQSAIAKAYTSFEKRVNELGESLASMPEIEKVVQQGHASYFQGAQRQVAPFNGVVNFFGDAFSSVFVDQELIAFRYAIYQQWVPQLWSQVAAGTLAATEYGKTFFRTAIRETGGRVVSSSVGKAIGTWLGTFLSPGIGNFIGYVVGDLVVDKLFSLLGSAFNFVSLKWLENLFNGNAEDVPFLKQGGVLATLAIVAGLCFFIFIVGPMSVTTIQDDSLVRGLGGGGENGATQPGFAHGVSYFSCNWSGPAPPSGSISVCPVSAPISQCPNGTFSHNNIDAYDFASGQGVPIVATHDGYVTQYTNSVPNNYFERTYGNMVVLVGSNAQGQQFCTGYAHLMTNIPQNVIDSYNNKTLIHAGDIIGYSDTSGNTYGSGGPGTGTHLHFEYNGPGLMQVPGGCAPGC